MPPHPSVIASRAYAEDLPVAHVAGSFDENKVRAIGIRGCPERFIVLKGPRHKAARPPRVDVLLCQSAFWRGGSLDAAEDALRCLFPRARSVGIQPGPPDCGSAASHLWRCRLFSLYGRWVG